MNSAASNDLGVTSALSSVYSADAPLSSSSGDKLGRLTFAQQLARCVFGWRNEQSLVVGVLGPWGSGKSSIVNMALEHVDVLSQELPPDTSPIVVAFNPWSYSQQHQLLRAFFATLSAALGRKDQSKAVGDLGKKLQTYARILAPAEFLIGFTPVGFLGKANALIRGAGKYASDVSAALAQDLEGTKCEIDELFKQLDRQLVIVMDDIDRLSDDEVRQTFQLVKLNANFPRTVYLLAFDENAVRRALQPQYGADFLEKIVQVAVPVPALSPEDLQQYLFDELNELLRHHSIVAEFDADEFGTLFSSGAITFFRSVRDVRRYINALHFTLPLAEQQLNLPEFMIVEMLRLFRPLVYRAIFAHRDMLIGRPSLAVAAEDAKPALKRFEEDCGAEWRTSGGVVRELFPRIPTIMGGPSYDSSMSLKWRKDRRICTQEYFDQYARLAAPANAISDPRFFDIWGRITDADSFRQTFAALTESQRRLLIGKIEVHDADLELHRRGSAISALLGVGDLMSMDGGQHLIDDNATLLILVRRMLRPLQPDVRVHILRQAIIERDIGSVAAYLRSYDGDARTDPAEALPDGALENLKSDVVQRVQREVASGVFSSNPHFRFLFWIWHRWSVDPEGVATYARDLFATDDGLPQALELLVGDSWSSDDRKVGHKFTVATYALETILPLDAIQRRLAQVPEARVAEYDERPRDILRFLSAVGP